MRIMGDHIINNPETEAEGLARARRHCEQKTILNSSNPLQVYC